MSNKAEKLLKKLRDSKKGVKRIDLEHLYKGFGFIIVENSRGPHDKVYHPEYPMLITSLPRHRKLGVYNVEQAINMVERLKELQKSKEKKK